MKLSYECMKAILSCAEDEIKYITPQIIDNTGFNKTQISFALIVEKLSESFDIPTIKYSYEILKTQEYITDNYNSDKRNYYITSITYKGHNFLNDII